MDKIAAWIVDHAKVFVLLLGVLVVFLLIRPLSTWSEPWAITVLVLFLLVAGIFNVAFWYDAPSWYPGRELEPRERTVNRYDLVDPFRQRWNRFWGNGMIAPGLEKEHLGTAPDDKPNPDKDEEKE